MLKNTRKCVWSDTNVAVRVCLNRYCDACYNRMFIFFSLSLFLNNDDRILICVVYRNGLSTHGDDDDGNGEYPEHTHTNTRREKQKKTPSTLSKCVGDKRQWFWRSSEQASKREKNVIRRDVLKGLWHANTLLNRFFLFLHLSFFRSLYSFRLPYSLQ